eukprot:CAMPEP_0114151228 /NCGR_PEP_ID=MMETSP0043_2-20121206/23143_1 /TAXON_ID=464988 /ORGANISM="Hemiselmis andersenii, Strain CCMP644" /LENGTH=84 /DNA_ID=CAMNT_0001246049 /DNA_START=80 /DNA_END=334 /DNA_ORIENTATION=+
MNEASPSTKKPTSRPVACVMTSTKRSTVRSIPSPSKGSPDRLTNTSPLSFEPGNPTPSSAAGTAPVRRSLFAILVTCCSSALPL